MVVGNTPHASRAGMRFLAKTLQDRPPRHFCVRTTTAQPPERSARRINTKAMAITQPCPDFEAPGSLAVPRKTNPKRSRSELPTSTAQAMESKALGDMEQSVGSARLPGKLADAMPSAKSTAQHPVADARIASLHSVPAAVASLRQSPGDGRGR